jgi:hypothetical protein
MWPELLAAGAVGAYVAARRWRAGAQERHQLGRERAFVRQDPRGGARLSRRFA